LVVGGFFRQPLRLVAKASKSPASACAASVRASATMAARRPNVRLAVL
jgi:hypothetical protein